MPSIRLVMQAGTPDEEEVWYRLSEYNIDNEGYLQFFCLHFDDGDDVNLFLFRKDSSLLELATGIFTGATSLRSAKGLLDDFNKTAARIGWKSRPGMASTAGLAIGSAVLLADFFKSQPLRQEGYYDGAGRLVLPRKIRRDDRKNFRP